MTEIYVKASGASAVARKTGPLVAGTVGMPAHFSFDDKWDGLNVIAVFEGSGVSKSVPLLYETSVTVPWECLMKAKTSLRIGLEGRLSDGSIVIPTGWANVGYIEPGAKATDDLAQEPSPTPFDILMAAVAKCVTSVNGVAPDENGNVVVEVPEGGGGSGITAAEKELILSLFKNTAYTADMSATISRLESLWSGSGDEPDEPVEPDIPDDPSVITHNVTKKLDGVSASNSATSVVNGASYVCNLTAHDGYTLDGAEVSVAMGGRDITSTAYSNGVINIAAVTGDVDITAVAKEIPSYSVTNNLTGMTNSNSATKMTEGDFYSATLSVMDGYELSSVVITMGGVDVTADVYNTDGTILITEVTGDIVITAVAAQPTVIPFITGGVGTTYAYSGGEGTTAKQYVNGQERIALCVRAGAASTYKVRATNNTESDITCDIWYGDLIGANVGLNNDINVYNAVKAKGSVTIAAGTSITFTATVNGGYYPGIVAKKAGLDYEFTGSIPEMSYEDVTELTARTAVKATLYKADGSDGDTSSTNWSFAPRTEDEIMSEDTEVEIVISNISDALVKGAIQFTQTRGAYTSGEITGYYYTRVSDSAYVYPALDIVAKYTVKAGNALCVNACGTNSDIVVKYRRV